MDAEAMENSIEAQKQLYCQQPQSGNSNMMQQAMAGEYLKILKTTIKQWQHQQMAAA